MSNYGPQLSHYSPLSPLHLNLHLVFLACLTTRGSAVAYWRCPQISAWNSTADLHPAPIPIELAGFNLLWAEKPKKQDFPLHLIVSRLFLVMKVWKTLMGLWLGKILWLLCQLQNPPSSGFIIQTLASCWLNNNEWFLNSTCNFCRKMYTDHLLLDYFSHRTLTNTLVTEGSLTVQARVPLESFQSPLWAPPTSWAGEGSREEVAFCPWLGRPFLYRNQPSIFFHLKICSFFNFQLKQCLWAFSSFPSDTCSLLGARTVYVLPL